jgi:hypothetical protein
MTSPYKDKMQKSMMRSTSTFLYIFCLIFNVCHAVSSVTSSKSSGVEPKGLVFQIDKDADRLKFHRCFDEGEAYSASFLISREHFLLAPEIVLNKTSHTSIESATFMFMETRKESKFTEENIPGAIIQTLDVLDFSVIHLSAYERSLKHKKMKFIGPIIDRIENVANNLEKNYNRIKSIGITIPKSYNELINELDQTLVLLPYAGKHIGVGNSELKMRSTYLKASFYSFSKFYQNNVIIAVNNIEDAEYIKKKLKLPAKEVWILPHLELLPLALLHEAKKKLIDNVKDEKWNKYKYIFFSESDQILVMRDSDISNQLQSTSELYSYINENPRHILSPHRLTPYAHELIKSHFNIIPKSKTRGITIKNVLAGLGMGSDNKLDNDKKYDKNDDIDTKTGIEEYKCCLPRQNCNNRESWVPIGHNGLSFIEIEGLMCALGNNNFRQGLFRACKLLPWTGNQRYDICQ